jgi:hypothetical protein
MARLGTAIAESAITTRPVSGREPSPHSSTGAEKGLTNAADGSV